MIIRNLGIIKPWHKQDLGGKRPEKSVCVVRYGGYGDLIHASSVFPYFKEKGYYVTVNTTPRGVDVIRHDPNIDEIFLQETGQVANDDLGPYWKKLGSNFSKLVQFSESVERSLLAVPHDKEYDLDQKERHRIMNVDYFKRMHEIAGADLPPRLCFYPTRLEKKWARRERQKMGLGNFVILWVLSGSSVHKVYTHTDSVVAELMISNPDARVVFVGEQLCQLLEDPWHKEKRVYGRSGKWSIRQTLSFAYESDVIIGPETGVLNAFAFNKDIPKIMMLSHSSPVNIGGSWENTEVLTPYDCECYPCHKMHYGWKTCNRVKDERNGMLIDGAKCQVNITKDRVYDAIVSAMKQRKVA